MRRPDEVDRKTLDGTRRHVEFDVRLANPNGQNQPWFLCITDGDIEQGSSGTCSIYYYSLTDSEWQDSTTNITNVRHFFLNTSESIPEGYAVKVEWYVNTWVITQIYCDAADWLEE
jgi:hypothetical protein